MTILSVAVLIGLLAVLIPNELLGMPMLGLGIVGAGWAWLGCNTVIVIMTRFAVWKISQTSLNRRIWRHFAGGIVVGIVLWAIGQSIGLTGLPRLILELSTAFALYFGLMIAAQEFDRKDLAYFLDIMNPRTMKEYVSEELKSR